MFAATAAFAGITFLTVAENTKALETAQEEAAAETVFTSTPRAGLSTEILLTSISTDDFSADFLSVSPVAQKNEDEQETVIELISTAISEIVRYTDEAYEYACAYDEAQGSYEEAAAVLERANEILSCAEAAESYVIAAMYVDEVVDLIDDAQAWAQQACEDAEAAAIAEAEAAAKAAEEAAKAAAAAYAAQIAAERQELVDYALSFVGVLSYKYGGTSLTYGADCSGFVQAIYAHFGYSIPRTSSAQASCGRSVSVSEIKVGDIVCYYGHVGIYIGNGMIVHSPQTGEKVTTTSMYYRTIKDIRRIIE